ncbi:MAG: septal ring lytic transglycosylase RlpA family protein [Hyphomicrobium sp.]|nr:septal ring lytic transglycosylase RlpA family protein [Hyphomicrobium sp.]
MRMILKTIAALLPLAALAPSQALAADAWRQGCSGPDYVCGSAAAPAKKAVKAVAVKTKKPAAVASSDKPVKASKKIAAVSKPKAKAKVASAPAKAKKTKVASAPVKAKKAKVAKAEKSSGGSSFQSGVASWYGGNFHGRKTANGETYNMNAWTAAHKTLPFGTRVRVTNTRNGDYVDVRINDRGPFIAGRVIDLSRAAAADIGVTASGVAPVKLTILGKG